MTSLRRVAPGPCAEAVVECLPVEMFGREHTEDIVQLFLLNLVEGNM